MEIRGGCFKNVSGNPRLNLDMIVMPNIGYKLYFHNYLAAETVYKVIVIQL